MARLKMWVNSGECTLAANTAKTLLQIKAASNQRAVVLGLRILGKQPAGGTDTPVKVRMTRSTTNFGTGSSAMAGKINPSDPETIQTSFASNFSVEPTGPTDSGLWWEIQPQNGVIEFYPPNQEIEIPGGAAINFEFTSVATPVLLITGTVEE
jgi:hypothetical protein